MSVEDVTAIAIELRKQGVRAVALKTHLEIANEQETVAGLEKSFEGHAAQLVRGAMLESLILAIMRMSDQGGTEKATIAKAAHLLREPQIRAIIEPTGDAAALDAFQKSAQAVNAGNATGALKRLRDTRNYRISHLVPSKNEGSFYEDVWTGLGLVIDATYNLNVGAGTTAMSFDADETVWRERSRAYWNRLLAGPSIPDPHVSRLLAKAQ